MLPFAPRLPHFWTVVCISTPSQHLARVTLVLLCIVRACTVSEISLPLFGNSCSAKSITACGSRRTQQHTEPGDYKAEVHIRQPRPTPRSAVRLSVQRHLSSYSLFLVRPGRLGSPYLIKPKPSPCHTPLCARVLNQQRHICGVHWVQQNGKTCATLPYLS